MIINVLVYSGKLNTIDVVDISERKILTAGTRDNNFSYTALRFKKYKTNSFTLFSIILVPKA